MRPALLVVPLVVACASPTATSPDPRREIGTIAGYQANDPHITVAASGRTVAVSVTTYGGGCESQGETDVVVNGMSAVVTPYDYTSGADACPDILKSFVHSTSIQFAGPGTAQITVRGLDWRTRTAKNPGGDTLRVVRTVELASGELSRVLELGAIAGFNNDDPRITVAQDARRVDLSITTYGGGCHSKGITDVVLNGLNADVTPYDYTALPGTTCTRELRSFIHQASLQFAQSGTAQIRIRGIDIRARTSGNPLGDTVTVVRTMAIP